MGKRYIFSNWTTVEVYAESEREAYEKCPGIDPIQTDDYMVIANDVALVEVEDDDNEE